MFFHGDLEEMKLNPIFFHEDTQIYQKIYPAEYISNRNIKNKIAEFLSALKVIYRNLLGFFSH